MALKPTLLFLKKKGIFMSGIFQNRLFWLGLSIKIIFSFLFAGHFLKTEFIPFVTYFFNSGFENPYEYFFHAGAADAFPYPPLMLYILGFLGGWLADLSPFFIRIPLLLADIGILLLLCRFLPGKETKIIWYYWLSPVAIYICYIHGQFDIIPIFFLLTSTYLLFKKRYIPAAVVLGLGIATKTVLILVIPFYVLYIWKNNPEHRIIKPILTVGISLVTFILLNLPYLFDPAFFTMVYENREQSKVWSSSISMIGDLKFYTIPAIYLILVATATRFKFISKDLFLIAIGFSFSVLLIFITPQPGWYFWIFPFFVYFTIRENKISILPLSILQIAFLLYFAVLPESDFFSACIPCQSSFSIYSSLQKTGWINADQVVSIALTFLQTCLLLNVYWVYKWGIKKNLNKKIMNKPFLIGIGGDSGVGKSTLTDLLAILFGVQNITIIRGDDMHKWERGDNKWEEITHLSPKANFLYEDIKHLKGLKASKHIWRRAYDHATGTFTEPSKILPKKIVIFEGLHPFYISAKRSLFDLKIFAEPQEELRLHWKISRDVLQRAYSRERVLYQLEHREKDSNKYIRSQALFSDIKISYYAVNDIPNIGSGEHVTLALLIDLETNFDLNELLDTLHHYPSLDVRHEYGMTNQILEVKGTLSSENIRTIAHTFIGDYDEFIEDAVFEKDLNGFLQLLFLFCIVYKAKNEV